MKSVIINFESLKKTEDIIYSLRRFIKDEEILIKITENQQQCLHNNYGAYPCRREIKAVSDITKLFGIDVEIDKSK